MQNNSGLDQPTKMSSMKTGGRTLLSPGKSITHENCEEIKDRINAQIEQKKTEIILDCKAVEY